jgi:hypothetical protein
MAAYSATYLEWIPMACIAGILLYVARAMIKILEIKLVWSEGQIPPFDGFYHHISGYYRFFNRCSFWVITLFHYTKDEIYKAVDIGEELTES